MSEPDLIEASDLRDEIIESLTNQGFIIDKEINPENFDKDIIKQIHSQKRLEQLKYHKNFLLDNLDFAREYSLKSKKLKPKQIKLKLLEVKADSDEAKLFLWWNLSWWSLPFDRPFGRQMRFLLWDEYHNTPFGLIGLQSPPLVSKIRDSYLGLVNGTRDIWINQSLYAQRLGALPPYNELLGGKMVGLSLNSNEIRERYAEKYENRITLMKSRKIPNKLLFITTTSAYGKSSVYERIKYENELVAQFLGFTSGAGTFQLSEDLYQKCLKFLDQEGFSVKRGYGSGPSRKMKLISTAFRKLKIKNFQYHNIKRGMYLIPLVNNLKEVIHQKDEPIFFNRNFSDLSTYWLNRWAIPRSERINRWKSFNFDNFFSTLETTLEKI
jgi:hypothetical protein